MKRFSRSVGGKLVCILLLFAAVWVLIGMFWGVGQLWKYDMYRQGEEEVLEAHRDSAYASFAASFLKDYLQNEAEKENPAKGIAVSILHDNKALAFQTEEADLAIQSDWARYTYDFITKTAPNGKVETIWRCEPDFTLEQMEHYHVIVFLDPATAFTRPDGLESFVIHFVYLLRYVIYLIMAAVIAFCVFLYVRLLSAAGRRPDTDEISEKPSCRFPFDGMVLIAAVFLLLLFLYLPAAIGITAAILLFTGLSMSAASRLRQGVLWKTCFLRNGPRTVKQLFSLLPEFPGIWRVALAVLLFTALELAVLLYYRSMELLLPYQRRIDQLILFWAMEKAVVIPLLLFSAAAIRRLEWGGARIRAGELTYHISTEGLFGVFRRHAETLNGISEVISQSVEEQLQSERTKTELITNVSHDIKTPLTSIINYASLIAGERCDHPTVTEYAEVLVRQSEKLKRLLDDLVEAAKISGGRLELSPVRCEASVLLSQASGEYTEKLANAGITPVLELPEDATYILADRRKMWRIFENLLENICHYAQSGTRAYLTLRVKDGQAVFTFKNISREQLDISAEELMERFVRGDIARNTEGHGLGLSIAKGLAELQGGSLQIEIDGDLFKAILTVPIEEGR